MAVQIIATQESPQLTQPIATKGNWGTASFNRGTELAFHIEGAAEPLVVRPALRTIIGRTPTHSTQTPDIDLADFGAIEKGVSRIHASIHASEDTLTIMDMGSRNGTHLNGQRIAPGQQRILRDGDELRLGKLVAYVHFKRATVPLAEMSVTQATALLNKPAVAGPFPKGQNVPVQAPPIAATPQIPDFVGQIGSTPATASGATSTESSSTERPVYKLPDFVGQLGSSEATKTDGKKKFRDRIRAMVKQSQEVKEFEAQQSAIESGQDVSLESQQAEANSNDELAQPLPPAARPASDKGMLGRLKQ